MIDKQVRDLRRRKMALKGAFDWHTEASGFLQLQAREDVLLRKQFYL